MAEAAKMPERTVYEAGAGRRTALSLAFLILLPFYASLPAMLARRLVHGLWLDTIGLIVFCALFTGLMALLAVQLYLSVRSRVELGETAVRITLPQGGRGAGATPMLHFLNKEIAYDKIAAVETRSVLFGNAMAPVLVARTLGSPAAILTESGLSFLGLGVQPPYATWGNILNDGKDLITYAWWLTLYPGLAILITVLSYNLVGEGIRDALDPRLRQSGVGRAIRVGR